MSCSLLRRTSCGPADSSAKVMALIAISSGSWPGSIHLRRIMMFVSSRPCRGRSPLIPAAGLVVSSGVLVRPERIQVTVRSIARHRRELRPRDKPAASTQGDQLPDMAAVPGDSKRLPVLDSIHNLPRPRPQVALRNLNVAHISHCSTRCYQVTPTWAELS